MLLFDCSDGVLCVFDVLGYFCYCFCGATFVGFVLSVGVVLVSGGVFAVGDMFKLCVGGHKDAYVGTQGDVLANDKDTVSMGDAGIKAAIRGSNVPNPDKAFRRYHSCTNAKACKGHLEGKLQPSTSADCDM